MDTNGVQRQWERRDLLKSAAGAGAMLAFGPAVFGSLHAAEGKDLINVALIGAGEQGKVLMEAARRIPGVRFQAVCDIWPYNRKWVAGRLRAYKHGSNAYEDYREMLDKEKGLNAVIVATPDCWHAEHTVACLNAGLHVYCEKEMSNTLEGARKMVEAARRTGEAPSQIGHQRRSNPIYNFCRDKLLGEAKLLGRITAVNGQWNRSVQEPVGCPKGSELDESTLKKYGYESMHQLRNWRWYKGLGGGPIVDLGSHQIDIYNWFLGGPSDLRARQRPEQLLRPEDPPVVRHGDGHLRVHHRRGPGQRVLPDDHDQQRPGLLRDVHGPRGDAARFRAGVALPGVSRDLGRADEVGPVDAQRLPGRRRGAGEESPRPRRRRWTAANPCRRRATSCRRRCRWAR